MIKKLLVFFAIVKSVTLQANDGVFFATGNTLVPLRETTIRLKKEILNLTRKEDWVQVDIYFEFYNPGPDKELTVGFVTPPAEGDVPEEDAKHPFIRDFVVMNGDKLLSYKIAKMKETGFKVNSKIADGFDFVYYFNIRFSSGITVIRHSYQYKGGSSVEVKQDFDYRLTTGTTWANKGIDDFEMNIDMGDDSYFSVPASFGSALGPWQLTGIGRISKANFPVPYIAESKEMLKMIYIRKGRLQLRAAPFRPTTDLTINFWNLHNEVHLWCDDSRQNDFTDLMELFWGDSTAATISNLSDAKLRLYRNLNYARMGYAFKDETLQRVFSKYNWYIPDPAVKAENVTDYYITGDLMKMIIAEEKKRKNNL